MLALYMVTQRTGTGACPYKSCHLDRKMDLVPLLEVTIAGMVQSLITGNGIKTHDDMTMHLAAVAGDLQVRDLPDDAFMNILGCNLLKRLKLIFGKPAVPILKKRRIQYFCEMKSLQSILPRTLYLL